MNHDLPTTPENDPPSDPHGAARLFADLMRNALNDALQPIRDDLAAIRLSLGMTNGQSRSLAGRVTDLEERVDGIEFRIADTEPPQ